MFVASCCFFSDTIGIKQSVVYDASEKVNSDGIFCNYIDGRGPHEHQVAISKDLDKDIKA